jgi:hypothetical protein
VTHLDLVTPQYAYVLGASFGVPLLESTSREYVVVHFRKWLQSPSGEREWCTLLRWAEPKKIFELIRDATDEVHKTTEAQTAVFESLTKLEGVPLPD